MFKVFATFAAFIVLSFAATSADAQTTATKDASGNYTQIKVAATVASLEVGATKSGATYTTIDGEKFPVYLSKNGKAFVIRTSKKTGNPYRSYLKEVSGN